MAKADKLDLYKIHKQEYAATKKPALVHVGPAQYLSITGKGHPGGPLFQSQVGALYGAAYTMKFASKAAGRDYGVCGLEGLYWPAGKGSGLFEKGEPDFRWKLLIRAPDFITAEDLKSAVAALKKKGKAEEVSRLKLETIEEGLSVQMLHVGPYNKEEETVNAMMAFLAEQGLKVRGKHHEIYISDPRRVAPGKLKTILRYPVG